MAFPGLFSYLFCILNLGEYGRSYAAITDADARVSDLVNTCTYIARVSLLLFEMEIINMPAPSKTRCRSSKTSKNAEMSSLEDKLKEKCVPVLKLGSIVLKRRFFIFWQWKHSPRVRWQATFRWVPFTDPSPTILAPNDCIIGVSSKAIFIPLDNSLNDELSRLSRVQNREEDILSHSQDSEKSTGFGIGGSVRALSSFT